MGNSKEPVRERTVAIVSGRRVETFWQRIIRRIECLFARK